MVGRQLRRLLLGITAASGLGGCGDRPPVLAESEFPPYRAMAGDRHVDPIDFVGAEACAGCHQDEYRRWASSTHGRAGGPPSPSVVLAPFDGTPIVFADASVTPTVRDDGTYVFLVEWHGTVDTLVVEGVVGGGHMVGGGTQGFFTGLDDGTLRFVPFDWSETEASWFCSSRLPVPGRWRRITDSMRLAECADWPPRRALGQIEGASCDTCHGSQIRTDFDVADRVFRTDYQGLEINCESCHGPGKAHIALVAQGGVLTEPNLGLLSMGTLSEDASLDTCFRCHATRLVLNEGDLPGEPLLANSSLLLPQLTDRPHLPDGRIRTFAYQLNHRASACYLDGAMTCTSCHEPHAQTYQDEYKRTLSGRMDDGQCLGCHVSKAEDPTAHTFHDEASSGSSCVGCHMPYLPQPAVGTEVTYARSDHVIPIPRPGFDEQFGVTSACAGCHAQIPLGELGEQVQAWYGEIKPWRSLVQGIARAGSVQDADVAAELLLQPDHRSPMAQASALSQFLIRFVSPDAGPLPGDTQGRLEALLMDSDLDVASLAAAALHLGQGTDPEVRALLADRIEAMDSDAHLLRDRWAAALRYVGDVYRLRQAPADAVRAYERAVEAVPQDSRTLEGLGSAHLALGAAAAAEAVLREAVRADPSRPGPLVRLAQALAQQDRMAEELALLEEAVNRFPMSPLVHFEMGNALLRRRELLDALQSFERTVELDPSLAGPRLGLAQILAAQGQPDRARAQIQIVLEFEPNNPQAERLSVMLTVP